MPLLTSRGVGQYVASEAHTFAFGTRYRIDATRHPIIYFTGGPGDDRTFLTAVDAGMHLPATLVEKGYPIISAAFGGANLFGNDTAIARIGQAWTYVKSQLNTKTDKFIAIGVSKGATACLNYMMSNPGNVACFAGFVPGVNVSDTYDNNRNGLAAAIDAAYGGNWAGSKATHDPNLNTATHAANAIPAKLWYSTDDTTVIPSNVTNFASAVGSSVSVQSMGAVGHSAVGVASDDLLNFIEAYR